jgi:hypothetical protein
LIPVRDDDADGDGYVNANDVFVNHGLHLYTKARTKMNTLHATPAHGKTYNTHKELIQDWIDGVEFDAGDYYFSIKDYDLLARTYNYDDICIVHDDCGISSATYIPLFKVG